MEYNSESCLTVYTVKGKKGSFTLAENVEGADNPSDIVEKFKEVYSTLYNVLFFSISYSRGI